MVRRKALPILKKMWRDFLARKAAVDSKQAEHYNSVLKFEKVKKVPFQEEMSSEPSCLPCSASG